MKILFIGYILEDNDLDKFIGPSIAGNKMQRGIVRGLKNKGENDVTILSLIPIAMYPKEKKFFIYKKSSYVDGIKIIYIPFINIFLIKQISQVLLASVYTFIISVKNKKKHPKLITFNMFPNISIATILTSKVLNLSSICIFADPPIFTENLSKMKKIEQSISEKIMKEYKKMVVLNESVIEKYNLKMPYIILDGGFNKEDYSELLIEKKNIKNNKNFIISYTGALTEYNGIKELLQGFNSLKKTNIELHIYGAGKLEKLVQEYCEIDSRIIFFGQSDNKEILKVQKNSDLLINPRKENEEISMLTFPSKMIEYLLSGTPVLTTKLNGLTEDYLKYVTIIPNCSSEGIKTAISEFLNSDYQEKLIISEKAKCSISRNKEWTPQVKKILDFIRE